MSDSNEEFPGYVTLSELGRGTTGVVYEVHDPRINRRMALKVPRRSSSENQNAARLQFSIEGWVLASLSPLSRNMPDLCLISENPGPPYYVRELVEGVDLEKAVANASIGLSAALAVIAEVAQVVEWLHGEGFVHRNLHPANVIVANSGPPQLIGFGRVARMAGWRDCPSWMPQARRDADVRELQQLVLMLGKALGQPISPALARIAVAESFTSAGAFGEALIQQCGT